jgi:hypothetical protein
MSGPFACYQIHRGVLVKQYWVVKALDGVAARTQIVEALAAWNRESVQPVLDDVRIYTGRDAVALADDISQQLAHMHSPTAQATRSELARRLYCLTHQPPGIPPGPGWVVLDAGSPRRPLPVDLQGASALRFVVTIHWNDGLSSSPEY